MGKIVAIGGGEIGKPGTKVETLKIDKEIIKLSGKKRPKLLFIPTASSDSESYYQCIKNHFGKRLNCITDVLYLIKEEPSKEIIQKKILSADIIYVGGGNTLKMMTLWRKLGVDKMLIKAHQSGIVLCGLSAGAICWFSFGNSDSRKFTSKSNKLIKVRGLGIVDALLCPHYDTEIHRQKDLKRMMKSTPKIVSITLDKCCAIKIVDDSYEIITSKKNAKARKVYYKKGQYMCEEIDKKKGKVKELLFKFRG